jgi:class 3 adenylate cyclase
MMNWRWWEEVFIGDSSSPVESKLYLASLLVLVLVCIPAALLNPLIGLGWQVQFFITVVFIYLTVLYATFRFGYLHQRWAATTFAPLLLAVVGFFWFFYEGISGVGGVAIVGLTALLMVASRGSPGRRMVLLSGSCFFVLVLLLVELLNNDLIGTAYSDQQQRAMDHGLVVATTTFFTGVVVLAYSHSYRVINAELTRARRRLHRLVTNVLPESTAHELLESSRLHRLIADRFESASVLFVDLVGFTELSASTDPEEIVDMLNDLFCAFDDICARHGIEKIKTIGDAYMAVAGVITPSDDHVAAAADTALAMLEHVSKSDLPLQLRAGMHSGPLVAGIVGTTRFAYDVWGDTVNTASRMESNGLAGHLQVSRSTWQQLREQFETELRGEVEVKGLGSTETWLVLRRRS